MNPNHLATVVRDWRVEHMLTQTMVTARGGPSAPTLQKIEAGVWHSRSPRQTLQKLDDGLGWPSGTAERVLRYEATPVDEATCDGPDCQAPTVDGSGRYALHGPDGPPLYFHNFQCFQRWCEFNVCHAR